MSGKKGHEGGGGGHDAGGGLRWLLTYADMITLLLALFIFLYSISAIDAKKAAAYFVAFGEVFGFGGSIVGTHPTAGAGPTLLANATSLAAVQKRIKEQEETLAQAKDFEAILTTEGLVLRFKGGALFASGSAEIEPAAMAALDAVTAELKNMTNFVRVEGHTDDVPTSADSKYASNWDLSAARAAAVVDYFIDKAGLSPDRFSLAGFGAIRPIARNVPGEGNPQNRRVDIVILKTAWDTYKLKEADTPTPTPTIPIEPDFE